MLEVELSRQRSRTAREVTEMAKKLSLAPFQKHSLGGCTIHIPTSNCHRRGGGISFPRATLCFPLTAIFDDKN